MQIHIDTATDDLPAVIRMLQALHGESPTGRLHKLMDTVGCQPVIKSGPDRKIEGSGLVASFIGVPSDQLFRGEQLKSALQAVDSTAENLGTTPEPDPAAHCYTLPNGDCVSEDPRCMHQPTPEQVFAAPSLFDSYVPGDNITVREAREAIQPHSDVTVDAAGLPWDARIHSGAKTKLANGNWKLLRGVDPALVASVEAELRGAPKPEPLATAGTGTTVNAPAPVPAPAVSPPPPPAPIAATPSAPPAPPAPPATPIVSAAPKPITNAAELVAAVMDKRFTTDQVNAACQAVGVENVASLLAKQDKLPEVLRELGV